jgi:3'-phosphoadenosine 5'-phosphosulfate sulfotransferase (PAPS reductase)/FAD synthetase
MLWENGRVVAWFSCGAASAVAAHLAIKKYGSRVVVVNCDTTNDEHPDNLRFRNDVQHWLGQEIVLIRSSKFQSVDDVFAQTKYMSGIAGARCTTELKKVPRFAFQQIEDVHVFGLTLDEKHRIKKFEQENFELYVDWLLVENEITKNDCYEILAANGIKRPQMYELGFDNANCIGCVKSQSPRYWNLIRLNFPATFEKRATRSRDLGVRLVKHKGERIFLDELPATAGLNETIVKERIECGIFCGQN